MACSIKIMKKPSLKNPILIAAWPGMGHVALKAATFMKDKLKAVKFAEVLPKDIFQIRGIVIRNNKVEIPEMPKSYFYYWKSKDSSNDLIIFIGDDQPVAGKENELAEMILKLAKDFNVKNIFTMAAMVVSMDHRQSPKVWGIATDPEITNRLSKYNINILGEGHISGMNGLFLGVAKMKGIDGICLLGEIPYYTTRIENPKSSKAVLQALSDLLGITIELSELDQLAKYMEDEIEKYVEKVKEGIQMEKETEEKKGPGYIH